MALVDHVILQNHMIKGLCNFMASSPSSLATVLPSLAIIARLVVELK